ncbi:MAG: hypothetical protein IT448_03945 [Phycisphaerales bacterium]|nr:hypothetical protein [Phycisphaerales bacterium]
MNRLWLAGFVVLIAGLVVSVNQSVLAQESAPAHKATLTGKVIVVYLKSDPKAGAVLENIQITSLGERYFLVGSGVDLGDTSRAGLIQWIPIDDIGRIHEFNDINDLRARTRSDK